MQALSYKLTLLEPLLATQAQSDEPNSAITYPFIPGSMVRGALIALFLQAKTLNRLDMDAPEIRNLFFTGKTQYLNAYPAYPDSKKERALPRPFSWLVKKEDADDPETPIYDFAIETQPWDVSSKAPAAGEFCWAKKDAVYLGSPQLQVTVHNASDDPDYKAEGLSQVYRYDALAAGQVFSGAIVAEDDKALAELKPLLAKISVLGGAATAGYGSVEVSDVTEAKRWQEYREDAFAPEEDEAAFAENSPVTLTCLSDVILRDESGRADMGLAAALGCNEVLEIFQKTRVVGGFNRTWGLPLDQAIAIQAGSVFVFPANCYRQLKTFVATGIGERRAEGFGRIAVNWQRRPIIAQSKLPTLQRPVAAPAQLSESSKALAKAMAKRQLQARVDAALTGQINRHCAEFSNLPSPTQLSRARLAAQRAWREKDLKILSRHFEQLTKFTRRDWAEMRTANGKFLPWLEELLEKPAEYSLDIGSAPVVGGERAAFADLRAESIARLLEGILRRAEKKAKEAKEGERYG